MARRRADARSVRTAAVADRGEGGDVLPLVRDQLLGQEHLRGARRHFERILVLPKAVLFALAERRERGRDPEDVGGGLERPREGAPGAGGAGRCASQPEDLRAEELRRPRVLGRDAPELGDLAARSLR